eukprot:3994550-Pleurochrysis_carterae.AAC.6
MHTQAFERPLNPFSRLARKRRPVHALATRFRPSCPHCAQLRMHAANAPSALHGHVNSVRTLRPARWRTCSASRDHQEKPSSGRGG